jgi:hypothetical protein
MKRLRSVRFVATLVLASGLVAGPALAQLSLPALTNSSNANEQIDGTATTPSRERASLVEMLSSPAGAFTTRYASLVSTDSDGAGASAGLETLANHYKTKKQPMPMT